MKVGDLIRVIQGGKLIPPWMGKVGIIVDKRFYSEAHPHGLRPPGDWFTVILSEELLVDINIDYLEKIDEDR